MVIHRRTPRNIPVRIHDFHTAPYMVSGYVWQRASPPEVYDTLVQVSCYKLLVTGYLNGSLGPNPNLQRDFPLIPWKGEIAVLFIGKRKPYVSRAPPQSLVRFAITQYMEVCIAHAEVGSPFLSYIKSIWPGHGVSGQGVSAFARTTMGPNRPDLYHRRCFLVLVDGPFDVVVIVDYVTKPVSFPSSGIQHPLTRFHVIIKTRPRRKWVSMIPEFLSSRAHMDPSGSDNDECASVQLGSSDMAPSATKTILWQRFPMRRYHVGSDGRLSNSPKVMDRSVDQVAPCKMTSEMRSFNLSSAVSFHLTRKAPNSYTTDMITQSVAAFLQPHTSSLSVSVVSHVMASLMGGDFGTEEFNQVLSTQLDALAISPQAKQDIIPALLGIAKLAKVQSQCASVSTSFSQPMVSEPEPELTDSNAEVSYQIRQRPFSSNSGSGYMTWYLGRSSCSILMLPTVPQAKTGHLYVHRDTSRDAFLYWILTTANRWERVSSGAEHPLNH
ncbi:hypothetical protein EDB85DRAFT_2187024 [Lactarius pseudohatsudake]|nr:hypothetical protein EDB85DRAFT_2187024 [Lactarius pseudohatsudake]